MSPIVRRHRPGVALAVGSKHAGVLQLALQDGLDARQVVDPDALELDVRQGRVHAIVVASEVIRNGLRPRITALAQHFPDLVIVGYLTDAELPQQIHSAMLFGRAGAKQIVLVDHFSKLREALDGLSSIDDTFLLQAMRQFQAAGTQPGWTRLIAAMFEEDVTDMRDAEQFLGVSPSTLQSRFGRRSLPTPSAWLVAIRLIAAARLLENPDRTVADVAGMIGHSSPQSFNRHVKGYLGVTAQELRETYTGQQLLDRFVAELIEPNRDALQWFDPLAGALDVVPSLPGLREVARV